MADRHLDRYLRGPEADDPESAQRATLADAGENGAASVGSVGGGGGGFELHAEAPCLMVDLVFKNGDRLALPYSYLTAVELDASGRIVLGYAARTVVIAGRALGPLYQGLVVHLVRRIHESPSPFDDGEQATWIKSITVDALPPGE